VGDSDRSGVVGEADAGDAADVVKVEIVGGVMTATLCDTDNRNALGVELIQGLRDAVAAANADPTVRAIVVTNEGNVFCAGANLKQRSKSTSKALKSGGLEDLLVEIQTSATPVIGRIAGHVVGGGNGLASALDISIASEDAKFGFTEVRLGVAPAIISVVCLPKMRRGEAMEAFLRGNRFSAARAAELGLINRAVPAAELDAAVEEVLEDLRKGGPNALGFAKRLVYEIPRMSQEDAFPSAAKLSGELFASDEAKEGMMAFLQKRAASWAASDSQEEDD
jgi:methylglutaconyl-CoA hydratase